jgi:hypothetical protein
MAEQPTGRLPNVVPGATEMAHGANLIGVELANCDNIPTNQHRVQIGQQLDAISEALRAQTEEIKALRGALVLPRISLVMPRK